MPHSQRSTGIYHKIFSCLHSCNKNVIGDGDDNPDGENVLFQKNILGLIGLVRCMLRVVNDVYKNVVGSSRLEFAVSSCN